MSEKLDIIDSVDIGERLAFSEKTLKRDQKGYVPPSRGGVRKYALPKPGDQRGKSLAQRTANKYDPETGRLGDGSPICGSVREDGSFCKRRAGWKTQHPGFGPCSTHGGNNPNTIQKYEVEMARARMVVEEGSTFGDPLQIDPAFALLWVVHATAGHVAWLANRIRMLEKKDLEDSPKFRSLLQMYSVERDRLTRTSVAAVKAGVSTMVVQYSEAQGSAFALACNEALRAIDMPPSVRREFMQALKTEMENLEGLSPEEIITRASHTRFEGVDRMPDVVVRQGKKTRKVPK